MMSFLLESQSDLSFSSGTHARMHTHIYMKRILHLTLPFPHLLLLHANIAASSAGWRAENGQRIHFKCLGKLCADAKDERKRFVLIA